MIKYLFLLLPLMFIKCEKDDLPAGIQTRVYGQIYDEIDDVPLVGHVVRVGEYTSHFAFDGGGSYEFVQWVDSSYTDAAGRYDFTFKTSGQGSEYKIIYEDDDQVWSYEQDAVEISNLGHEFEKSFSFLQLYPVDLTLVLNGVVHLPVSFSPPFKPFGSTVLNDGNTQLTRRIYISKNYSTELAFWRTSPDDPTRYQKAAFTMPATNTTALTQYTISAGEDDFSGQY